MNVSSLRVRARIVAAAVAVLTLLGVGLGTAGANAAVTYPIQPNEAAAGLAAVPNPAAPPPGVNDFTCPLSAAHPRPVILVPSTFANMEDDFGALGPILANDGYCVFALNYGGTPGQFVQSTGPVPASAKQLAGFIDTVQAHYPAATVDLVGHSQGGMLAEYVAKVLGYAPKIAHIVGLSPSTHGTTLNGLFTLANYYPGAGQLITTLGCAACADQMTGSPVITALDNGPIAQPGIAYTVLETKYETVVTPVGSAFINEPGVTNTYVQSLCPNDAVDHANLSYDNTTIRLVLNALDPAHAAAPACGQSFPAPAQQQ